GLQSVNNSGQPGSANTVRIRGRGSINGSTQPLYIVDGVPVNVGAPAAGPSADLQNSMSNLNPADIETVTILKDASSTSIYGARGANGIILITTKKGKQGKTRFSYSSQVGVSSLTDVDLSVLSASEYIELHREAQINSGTEPAIAVLNYPDTDVDTDWYGLAFQDDALTQQHNFSASGGNEKSTFYASMGYMDQQGIALGSYLKRLSAKLSVTSQVSDKVKFGMNVNGTKSNQGTPLTQSAFFISPVVGGYLNAPNSPAYNEDGTPNQDIPFSGASFLAVDAYNDDEFVTYRFLGNVFAEFQISDNLKFRTNWGTDLQFANQTGYDDPRTQGNTAFGVGRANKDLSEEVIWNVSNILTWSQTLGEKHNYSLLVGQEAASNTFENIAGSSENFSTFAFRTLVSGATPVTTFSNNGSSKLMGFFTNLNYSFDSKYHLNATYRKDASSRFGPDNQWGSFWAVGGNWVATNEAFLSDVSWLNTLKVLASYGIQGNLPGGLYDHKALYGSGYDYGGLPGNGSNQSASPSLKWEEQQLFEVGIELAMFDRVSLDATYYSRETEDLILDVPISLTNGVNGGTIRQNFGAMKNSGFEFALRADVIRSNDVTWSVNGNITLNTNEITRIDSEFDDGTKIRREGEAYDTFWMPVWAGVNPANGNPMWYDENDNLTQNYADAEYRITGTAEPEFFGGFGSTLRWKALSLNALFTYSYGNEIYNNAARIIASDGAFSNINQNREQLDRWQQPGDLSPNPRRLQGGNNNSNEFSSRWLEDGSFLRLRTVNLSYELPSKYLDQLGFTGIRMYVQGQNLLTFTEFTMDPEQAIQGTSFFIYPNSKTISVGLDLQF
ncbi:SusC/RagA family TonB-linked outer membrane protein, partial [Desulfosarcina sp.]|nr:SusC/RagA family TonB-linked outer membrane protein [Desulfosarcina sp.]